MLETMTTILAAGGSLMGLAKGATDIAQNMKSMIDKPDVDTTGAKQLISDLLDRLIRIQTEQIAMNDALLAIDHEQRRIDQFKADSVRYMLTRTEQGSLLYELDESQANGQPAHCICATCYVKHIKSILQPVAHNTLACGQCGGQFFKPDGRASAMFGIAPRSNRFDGF